LLNIAETTAAEEHQVSCTFTVCAPVERSSGFVHKVKALFSRTQSLCWLSAWS
jgi:hypothetical protein